VPKCLRFPYRNEELLSRWHWASAHWPSLSIKAAGTRCVLSALSFNFQGDGTWNMPPAFESEHPWVSSSPLPSMDRSTDHR
jgi:hypothetical protein